MINEEQEFKDERKEGTQESFFKNDNPSKEDIDDVNIINNDLDQEKDPYEIYITEPYISYINRLLLQGLATTITEEEYQKIQDEKIEIEVNEAKTYVVDISLKEEGESMEDFYIRAKLEKLYTFKENSEEIDSTENKTEKSVIEIIKEKRISIDKILQQIEVVYGAKSDVWKSVFITKSWLGKLLGQLGNTNPYTTEKPITDKTQIPSTVDIFEDAQAIRDFDLKSYLEKVLILRTDLGNLEYFLGEINVSNFDVDNQRLAAIAVTNSYINCCEAKFELGYQLSLIKKS